MNIQELLSKFEPARLKVQFLRDCMTSCNANKARAKITFETDAITPNALVGEAEPIGIVVWIDRKDWETFKAEREKGGV